MRMQFANINSFEHIVEFHDLHLYYTNESDESMEYLFSLNKDLPNTISKKYLLPIDTKSFVQFVSDCLTYPTEKLSKDEFEINIIQLIDKYNQSYTLDVMNLINIKIGSLLLNHHQYKNFPHLKKIEKQFGVPHKFIKTTETQFFNSQIGYLLIIINNLIGIKKTPVVNLNYKIPKSKANTNDIKHICSDNFNYLDFIFDYWS